MLTYSSDHRRARGTQGLDAMCMIEIDAKATWSCRGLDRGLELQIVVMAASYLITGMICAMVTTHHCTGPCLYT